MEQRYEFILTTVRKTVLEQDDINLLYIPLHGKHTTNPEEEPFDLAQKINEFFVFDESNTNDPRVMLLLGDTGSGKSVFTQQVFKQLWKTRKESDPIPLWIPLPELLNPFNGSVEEVLMKYEFTESQILAMKRKEKFIFIVDGYDELHQFQNCYVTNGWHEWKAKVLITCRSQALYYQKDPDKYFVPFSKEQRLPWLLRKLYVAPFSPDQIKAYVAAYNRRIPAIRQDPVIKLEDFDKIPGLKELIITPFLLHLAVESLPDILANIGSEEENPKMTQAKLYDVFIEQWFTRQVEKMRAANIVISDLTRDIEIKQRFWDYCKRLAQQMHANEVTVIPYIASKAAGRLFGIKEKRNYWEKFFSEETEVLRSACPLKRMGDHHYGFIHSSFVEYFSTRAMYEEIQEEVVAEKCAENIDKEIGEIKVQPENVNTKKPKGGIHVRVFVKERQAIQFISDRIEMSKIFKQKMLNIVETSKTNDLYGIGAANAITGLVRAGVTFNGADLRGIRISGADISGGYFDNVDLSGSDLRHVIAARTWLKRANLSKCELEGLDLMEHPSFKHKTEVLSIVYRPEIN